MANRDHQLEIWKSELEKKLRKLEHFLEYKNHRFCRNYLGEILEDFFKNGEEKSKKQHPKKRSVHK